MKKTFVERKAQFEQQWQNTFWFKLLKLGYKLFWFIIYVFLQILNGIFWLFLSDRNSVKYDRNFKGMTQQDDRNTDDIWKLTSGNDYYDKKPPDRFS